MSALVLKDHEWEMAYGKSNGQVLDDVACAGLLIRNWLHMETPETINKKIANIIEKLQFITMLTAILRCYTDRKKQVVRL